ncbi:hypothetical protein [Nocardia gamkensis]|uniref:Uncharacterized protein n=1 Tax=Nocardia gamkensis TaxID=352869 RepID=A0A7X6L0C0_9NOCA|nr:hypothetical protein [Nocardia gamkensis]NKY25529.1 hypothetical protein [Nocardia gamkensis]NQE69712.1 hypothetical protein [Nocardia gamkensis]
MTDPQNESSDETTRKLTPEEMRAFEEMRKSIISKMSGMKLPELTFPFPIIKFESPLTDAIERINSARTSSLIDLSRSLTANMPKFHLDLPALSIDYSRLFGPTQNLQNLVLRHQVDTASLDAFKRIYEEQRRQFESILDLSSFQKIVDSYFPPNWRGAKFDDTLDLELLILDEGLALGWVPDADLLQKLFDASTRQERRRLLGRHWKSILKSCRSNLVSVDDSELTSYRDFALKAIDSLEAGFTEGGQALAANLLDTMLRETLDGTDRRLVTHQGNRLDLNSLPFRASIVFGGIWGSFTEFWASRGDEVPRAYSRHASAHAVGRRQYSRINAVIAIMHVTAYIKLLESGDLNP